MGERDYIDRTIETVRNHRNADNCWPQWANIFADEIEDLRALLADTETERDHAKVSLVSRTAYLEAAEQALREVRAERDEARNALRKVAALRKRWEEATPDDPWDALAAFWDALAIADTALEASGETKEHGDG